MNIRILVLLIVTLFAYSAHSLTLHFQGESFELLEEIGRGGFGITIAAVRVSDNRKVALKFVELSFHDPRIEIDPESREIFASRRNRFLQSIRRIHEINEVVRLARKEQADSFQFFPFMTGEVSLERRSVDRLFPEVRHQVNFGIIVMPQASESLHEMLNSHRRAHESTLGRWLGLSDLSAHRIKIANRVFQDLLIEISLLAKHNLVHLDLKPDNIAFNREQGRFSMIDWDSVVALPLDGPQYRTPLFAAPEVSRGEVNIHAGLYSLAANLLAILDPNYLRYFSSSWTDESRFEPKTHRIMQLLQRVLEQKNQLSSSDRDQLEQMVHFIGAGLEFDPKSRIEKLRNLNLNPRLNEALDLESRLVAQSSRLDSMRKAVQKMNPIVRRTPMFCHELF